MKHFKLFSWRDVSTTLAMIVGSPSAHRWGTMLKPLFLAMLFLIAGIGNVWAETATLQITSGVTADKNLTDDASNTWAVSSDGDYTSSNSYIQCGTNKKAVTYIRLTTSAFSEYKITKVQVWGTSKANTNVSAKVIIGGTTIGTSSAYTTQNASNGGTEFSVNNTNEVKGDLTIEISRPSSANGAIYFNKAIVTYEEDGGDVVIVKTLKSIAVSGQTTVYEQFDSFSFDGTCTATYSVTENDVAQDDENEVVTPTTVSSPDMSTTGEKEVTVSFTDGDVTKTANYTITVNEHVVTPGEYDIIPNNTFFNTSANGSITGDAANLTYTGTQDDITISYAKGSGSYMYINASQVRMYPKNTMVISVPEGYVITSVVFTGSTWPNAMNANVGSVADDKKTWSGSANSITFTGGGSSNNNQCTKITVTYEAIAPEVTVDPSSLSFTAKQNIAVDGKTFTLEGANLTSGLTLAASTGFSVSPTSLTAEAAMAQGGVEVTVTPATPTATTTPVEGTVTISGGGLASNVEVALSMAVTSTYAVAVAVNDGNMGSATINNGAGPVYAEYAEDVTLVATPESGYEFVNWTASSDDIEIANATSVTTTAAIGAAGTITANFQAQACTGLAAPVLDEVTKTYQSATIAWLAVDNADGYVLNIVKHEGSVAVLTDEIIVAPEVSFEKTGLDANTQYDYTVMAVGDGTSYCDESNPTLAGSFTTSDYPAATLSLVENGGTPYNWGTGLKLNSVIALPEELAGLGCSDKVLVGWDADENCATAPAYAKGANYTIASTADVLYAVFATEQAGEVTKHDVFATTSLGSTNTVTSGFAVSAQAESKSGYYQDGSGTTRYVQVKVSNAETQIIPEAPTAITVKAKIGGGTTKDPLTNNVYAVLIDADQNAIGDPVLLTTKVTAANGSDFEASMPIANYANVRGARVTHEKETSYNVRYYAISLSYSTGGGVSYTGYTTECTAQLPVLDAPTFPVAEGVFYESTDITILAADDASIYYTTDGTTPSSTNGTLYEGAITLNAYGTYNFKAIAVQAGHEDSEVAEATYYFGMTFASVSDLYSYLEANSLTSMNNVKVTGLVSQIKSIDPTKYTNGQYYISVNGQKENELYIHNGKYINGADFTVDPACPLNVGDQVTIIGNYAYTSNEHRLAQGNTIVARTAAAVASVAIGGELEKKNYSPEDNQFSHTGLTATATHNTGYTKDVTALATWTNNLTNDIVTAPGNVEVTATYEGQSDTKQVAVTYTTKTLDHITLSYTSTTAYVGMALPTPTVTASYVEDIADEDVTALVAAANGFDTESAYNGSAAGSYTINVSYTLGEVTKSAEYTVTVKSVFDNEENPHNVADATAMIIASAYQSTTSSTDYMWVRGIVSGFNGNNLNRYYISEDGSENGQLYVYNGKYFNNATFTESNKLHEGDEVILKATILNYQGNTPELTGSQVVSQLRAGVLDVANVASFEVGQPDLAEADLTINRHGSTGAITFSCDENDALEIVDNKLRAKGEAEVDVEVTATMAADNMEGKINFTGASTTFMVHVIPAQTRYSVTFDMNGGSADPEMSLGDQLENANVEIPDGTYTKDGYKFNGWSVMAGETPVAVIETAGVYSFTMPAANVTITAQWAEGSDFTWDATAQGYSNEKVLGTECTSPVTITFAKASANNDPKYFTNDATARFYTNGTLTITAPAGKLITAITFNTTISVSANVGTYSEGSWSGLAGEVVFTASATCKIKNITVTYINGTVTTLSIANINLKTSDGETALSITKNVEATIIYEDLDESVATISANKVTPVAEGSTTVTARIAQGANYTAAQTTFTITVAAKTIPVMSFPQAEYNANLGESFTAPTLTKPEGVSVAYSSDNAAVSVDANTGAITINAEGTAVITATSEENNDYAVGTASYTLNVVDPNKDVLTADAIEAGSSYTDWSNKTFGSSVKYAGNSKNGDNPDHAGAIQMRSSTGTQAKSGIVTTTAIGYLKNISATETTNGNNYLEIYAKGSQYESAADLYSSDELIKGVKIGTIGKDGGAMEFETGKAYSDNYKYIGIKSNNGAVYYDAITIEWTPAEFASYNVTYKPGEAEGLDVVESIEEGSNISLKAADTFTAPEGKIFAGWLLTGEEDVREAGSKYTVTAAATFTAQWISVYTITYTAGEGTGDDVVVENVPIGNYELAANTFTAPENKEFAGWKLNNAGETLAAGSNFTVGANASFTAQWSIVKQAAGLAYATTSYMITRGRSFEAPELTNLHGLTVTYSGNNDEVATVDAATGALTLKGVVGEVTVTATSAETDYYYAGEASYTLKVKDANLSGGWERLTSSSTLVNGMNVIIAEYVSSGEDIYAMGAQNANNRGQVAGTLEEGKLVADEGTAIFTLVAVGENTFAFKAADKKYLYAASSSSNYLKSQAKIDGNATWTIVLSEGGKATITAQGNYTHNVMRYNKNNGLFSCYTGNQQDIALYSKTVAVDGNTNASTLEEYADVVVADNATLVINTGTKPLGNITGNVEVNAPLQAEGVHLGVNNTMTVNSTVNVPSFSISVQLGSTGQATNVTVSGSGNIAAPEGYVDMELSDGANRDHWHSFTVPFEVDALNGIYDAETGAPLQNEVNYAIMDYHGDIRANGQYGWKKYRGTLQPGTFYLITIDGESKVLRFMKKAGSSYVAPNSMEMKYNSGSGASTDFGWCGVGNQNMFNGYVPSQYVAQVLNATGDGYEDIDADQPLSACIPFFIQVNVTVNLVMNTSAPGLAPRRMPAKGVERMKVFFGNENYTDKLYISASEEATNEYEIGKDLLKMTMTNTPSVPQIFGNAYGNKLCMVYAPMSNDQAVYDLSLYAPQAGEYTISAPAMENAELYLTYEGNIIWNLSMSEYPINLNKGTTEGYGLLLKAKMPQTPTGIENGGMLNGANGVQKVIIDENVFILRGGQMYDVTGKMVK